MSVNIVWIRRLIWTYFWLVIFEGVLRKWVLPSLAGPLLLIRVPVVVAIFVLGYRAGIFPRGLGVASIVIIGLASLFAGFAMLPDTPAVALYGFQADFLNLPLIFVIPRVFTANDARTVGFWTLVLSMPMALLMVVQFHAPATAWINAGAGEGAQQITLAEDHIRAAGTFSFVTGPVFFYTLVAAFLFDHLFTGKRYPLWLVIGAAIATAVATAVCGSRSLVVSLGILIGVVVFIGLFLQPSFMLKSLRVVAVLAIVGLMASQLPIFNEGMQVFSVRVDQASSAEGGTSGIFQSRVLDTFTEPFDRMSEVAPLGQGIGVGTVGGATLMTGTVNGVLQGSWETEWERNIFEAGPVLGLLFVMLRILMFGVLAWVSLGYARRGITLPLLLFPVYGPGLLQGNFGQATVVGFVCFVGGLALAAMRVQPAAVVRSRVPADALPNELTEAAA